MIRVLQVVGGMNRAGAETWLLHVLRESDPSQVRFDFLVHSDQPYDYDDQVREYGGRILVCANPRSPLKHALNFRRIIKEYGPYDVIHSHVNHFNGFVMALARWQKIPIRVSHSHSDSSSLQERSSRLRKGYYRVASAVNRRFLTDGLAGTAQAASSLFGSKWESDSRIRILRYGIDLEAYSSVSPDNVREEFGIPEDAFVIGQVGRFVREKNHQFSLQIARELCSIFPDTYFLFVGEGELKSEMESRAKEMGLSDRIIFTGVRSDVSRLMTSVIDTLIMPSLYEGLPLVGIEAQASGLRCLLSNTISGDVRIVSDLVEFLPITDPTLWAREINRARYLQNGMPQNVAHLVVQESDFNIANGLSRLMSIYGGSTT